MRKNDDENRGPNYAELASAFLRDSSNSKMGLRPLLFWKGGHYRWSDGCYREVKEADHRAEIFSWLQRDAERSETSDSATAHNIIENLKGMTFIDSDVEPNTFLEVPANRFEHFIPMSNGIVRLTYKDHDIEVELLPHTPEFFCQHVLPYEYKPEAVCPIWDRVLSEILPDAAVRNLLQEWVGLNLIPDTSYAKFFLMIGEGANGKSVIAKVMIEILGQSNVSAVGLEAFSSTRTFMLGATVGKLANIVEEMDQIDKAPEGLIKNFVSGGKLTIDRKHRDPFDVQATARITLCTNVLPRFGDRTDGIWRRAMIIPFTQQILDESKQDRRLIDPLFWKTSGELPGIFNWALAGLIRLKKRGRFAEPDICVAHREEYRLESNPAKAFLQDHCVMDPEGQISKGALMQSYRSFCAANGFMQLAQPGFSKEVKRVFPKVEETRNARIVHDVTDEHGFPYERGVRDRVWLGLRLRSKNE